MMTEYRRFNEAAGIHRRKRNNVTDRFWTAVASMRPPEFTGGNMAEAAAGSVEPAPASMRPPEFTGGNATSAAGREARQVPAFTPPLQ